MVCESVMFCCVVVENSAVSKSNIVQSHRRWYGFESLMFCCVVVENSAVSQS